MKVPQLPKVISYLFAGALVLPAMPALAQSSHSHETALSQSSQDRNKVSALVKVVRDSTERFKDVAVAEGEDYKLLFGCVTGPDYGAMGLHYVNLPLVFDGEVDATKPEIVIYEPAANGRVKMTGADFLVIAEAWDAKHPGAGAPELMGQLFHYFEAPNRFGLPAFYTLHVWAWKDNPAGTFTNWHANVSCDAFKGQNP